MVLLLDKSNEGSKQAFWEYLKQLPSKTYLVDIKQYRETRSNRQNRYYWGVVIQMISEETGMDEMEVHETLKKKFIKQRDYALTKSENKYFAYFEDTGEMIPTSELEEYYKKKGSKDLDTKEFKEYIEKIHIWAANFLGLNIPDPEANIIGI